MLRNTRIAKYEIIIHFLREFELKQLHTVWQKIKGYLRRGGVIAWVSAEITRSKSGQPTNRIHRHFLVDGEWQEQTLRMLFKNSCLCSGLLDKDFRIDCRSIYNFKGLVFYTTKTNRQDKVILFEKHLGIRKFETIGPWFLDESGTPISRTKAWENVKKKHSE